jgi:phage tail sheath gpL-like
MSIVNLSAQTLPGTYGQIAFAAGPITGGSSTYSVLLMGNMLSSGTAYANRDGYVVYGPDTQVPMQTTLDAQNLFGLGSSLALAVADFFALNKQTSLYVIPVPTDNQGDTGTATWVLTITTSTQTAGSISLQVGPDAPVITSVSTSDTPTTIAANISANLNATGLLPVVASSSAGVLTLTAKQAGARGNWLRAFAKITSGTGVTLSQTSPSFFTSGTGSDSVGYTAVLNALAVNGQRYYYYVPEAGADSVDGSIFENIFNSQILGLAAPPTFLRQRLIGGSVDTLGNTQTVMATIGSADPRAEAILIPQDECTPFRLAVRAAAAYSQAEIPPLSAQDVNFDGFGNDAQSFASWNVPAPLNGTGLSVLSQQSATITGITPLANQRGGRTSIVKRVTNHFFSNSSSSFDGRITDGGKVTICDFFTDDVTTQLIATFPRCLIAADPLQGSPPAIPGVATPGLVKQVVQGVINNYASRGLINGPNTLANLQVRIDPNNPSQIDVTVGLFPNNPLHIINLQVLQSS